MIPVGLAILCLFVLCVLNFCSMSLQEQADIQVCSGHLRPLFVVSAWVSGRA